MSKLYGVVNGVYYCNMERTKELSDRMYKRNIPSQSLEPQYTMRPVQTRFTRMAILDERNQETVPLNKFAPYNVGNQFNPGSGEAPWSGFATNINEESKLRNLFEKQDNSRVFKTQDFISACSREFPIDSFFQKLSTTIFQNFDL